ncbi:DNA ligase 4 isoform X1 [Colletes gigas]|uniref:DNA ligase 4 isoform X1 n=1 Tax=Colletes gigas TaxID=935657 RepID=UPI001C9B8FA2|nr:DNA ligase 4 isoform X1 [Colletes gigas]
MSVTLAAKIEFVKLCNVLEEIKKARVAKRTEILEKFIQQCRLAGLKHKTECPDADVSLFSIMRLLLPSRERERGAHNLKEKSLANLYVRVFCLGKGSKDANNLVQYKTPTTKKSTGSDFAEKAYWILRNRLPRESSGFTIERINLFLDNISSKNDNIRQKDETFKVLLGKTNALEFKWITRIILKDLKLGIGMKRILQVFHPDANALSDVSTDLRQICETLSDPQLRYHHDIQIFSHFKPMLLERCRIEDTKTLFSKCEQYFVQTKYDGERSQMHMKDGKYKYFTRQGYDITKNYGYGETSSSGFMSSVFHRLLKPQCKSIILDGELMGWHKQKKLLGSKGMNFDVKKLSENSHHQPCFIALDIILYNDVLLINELYEKRLKILEDAFKEEEGCLMLCKSIKISQREELCRVFNESIQNKEEGIVLKKYDMKYKPNVRDGSNCYKIKAEYSDDLVQDVDLIILGGYYGGGKFMGLMKSFLMAVASPSNVPGENPSKFLSVVSVSNGLSMETLKELWKRFEGKWQNECPENVSPPRLDPPNKWIRPEESIILTIRATEMTQSKDYPTGYSLRFPRVMDVRTDKPWYSVCTTTELLSLIKDSRPIQKLTKRDVDCNDTEAPKSKVRRTKQCSSLFEEKSSKSNILNDSPIYLTRLFDGKEICVINGDNELSKTDIEEILLQHRAKVVKNPLKENYCVIVGNVKPARAKNIVESKEYDVVSLDWFKRVTKEENWSSLQDFLPWDLICSRESTERRLAQYYDEYYDNFTVDADEESLARSFKKVEETVLNAIGLDHLQMKEMDKELFDNGISPYSIFRGMVGYFDNQSDQSKFEFSFMAGIIKDTIDNFVTHVFIDRNSTSSKLKSLIDELQIPIIIVKSEWIGKCFGQNQLISNEEYLINL